LDLHDSCIVYYDLIIVILYLELVLSLQELYHLNFVSFVSPPRRWTHEWPEHVRGYCIWKLFHWCAFWYKYYII